MGTDNVSRIVAFAKDWDDVPTCITHIFREMGKTMPVLWLNSIGTRKPSMNRARDFSRIFSRLGGLNKRAELKENMLRVMSLPLIPKAESRLAVKFNRMIFRRLVGRELADMGEGPVEYWCSVPNAVDLLPEKDSACSSYSVIYYCVDDWSGFSHLDGIWLFSREKLLLERSDAVFTPSKFLEEKCKKIAGNRVFYVPHGVDYNKFASSLNDDMVIPSDIKGLPCPVIGFYGNIDEWVDLNLLEYLSEKRPNWSFVIIGQVYSDVARLKRFKNVYFIGKRLHDSLPSYCKGFDAAIIPYDMSDPRMRSVNPVKVKEILAAGIPVVSSNLPELEVQKLPGVILCRDKGEWIPAIEKQLALTDRKSISGAMREWDWPMRVQKIMSYVRRNNE